MCFFACLGLKIVLQQSNSIRNLLPVIVELVPSPALLINNGSQIRVATSKQRHSQKKYPIHTPEVSNKKYDRLVLSDQLDCFQHVGFLTLSTHCVEACYQTTKKGDKTFWGLCWLSGMSMGKFKLIRIVYYLKGKEPS